MTLRPSMTTEEAVLQLRSDPSFAALVRDAYLGPDVADSAQRFYESGEFAEVRRLLGPRISGATLLDVGAGAGIASMAFIRAGANRVVALEPDPSTEVGRGAMARLAPKGEFEILDGVGESIPLPDTSTDIVYCRQVLHHAQDLRRVMAECLRVLKPGGILLACREHVVDDEEQLREFLENHIVNRMAGGESAYPLSVYLDAIASAGLIIDLSLGPWDSVINAFPEVRTQDDLRSVMASKLSRKIGPAAGLLMAIPAVRNQVARKMDKRVPGRMYTFMAHRRG
jgi:SAM-dependent methyltransferase